MSNIGEIDERELIVVLISSIGKGVGPFRRIDRVADYRGNPLTSSSHLEKAPTDSKRDVMINGEGYSLKSSRRSAPAIVNHTTREKWLRVCEETRCSIEPLDAMVSRYWSLREAGAIGEDVRSVNSLCPFGDTDSGKAYLKSLINYFLFTGTGSRTSEYPADYMLEFDDPRAPSTWDILTKKSAFDSMYPRMVFSLRGDKGMPRDYGTLDPSAVALLSPWVRFIDGQYRGALHIRTR